mmetsp:Transcript_10733/g.35223  ORF Transcript_10733/g.35223 Transcript_10733/m.35223 type:complete len:581 (-) Transcript_10733:276-2018(-)
MGASGGDEDSFVEVLLEGPRLNAAAVVLDSMRAVGRHGLERVGVRDDVPPEPVEVRPAEVEALLMDRVHRLVVAVGILPRAIRDLLAPAPELLLPPEPIFEDRRLLASENLPHRARLPWIVPRGRLIEENVDGVRHVAVEPRERVARARLLRAPVPDVDFRAEVGARARWREIRREVERPVTNVGVLLEREEAYKVGKVAREARPKVFLGGVVLELVHLGLVRVVQAAEKLVRVHNHHRLLRAVVDVEQASRADDFALFVHAPLLPVRRRRERLNVKFLLRPFRFGEALKHLRRPVHRPFHGSHDDGMPAAPVPLKVPQVIFALPLVRRQQVVHVRRPQKVALVVALGASAHVLRARLDVKLANLALVERARLFERPAALLAPLACRSLLRNNLVHHGRVPHATQTERWPAPLLLVGPSLVPRAAPVCVRLAEERREGALELGQFARALEAVLRLVREQVRVRDGNLAIVAADALLVLERCEARLRRRLPLRSRQVSKRARCVLEQVGVELGEVLGRHVAEPAHRHLLAHARGAVAHVAAPEALLAQLLRSGPRVEPLWVKLGDACVAVGQAAFTVAAVE